MLVKHAWWMPKWLDNILPNSDVEGESLSQFEDVGAQPAAVGASATPATGAGDAAEAHGAHPAGPGH